MGGKKNLRLWRQDYQSKMNKIIKHDSGVTLVELLAVLALLSVVIVLGGAIHMFGQKQFQAQTESANQNNDLSYAMTVMSSDLRKRRPEEIRVKDNEIQIKKGENYEALYFVEKQQLIGNNEVLVKKITEFNPVKPNLATGYIEINISINSSPGISNKNYQTTIYFRDSGGD